MNKQKNETWIPWLMITLGAILAAFALEEFLVPNDIFDGGVTGISMILAHYLPVKLGFLVLLVNIPFVIVGLRALGRRLVLKMIYAVALFSLMTAVFEPLVNATSDTILAVVFGGIFLGAGVGLVLRGGGCLDGTEIVAILVNRKFSISVGHIILAINVLIYSVAGIVFGLDRGMYSLIMYFITSRVIDIVEIGLDNTKSVMIVTESGRELADLIYQRLGRTVTFLEGTGYVSSQQKQVLYCVVTRAEIFELKQIISSAPDSAFTTISDVSEIVGHHIKSNIS